MELKDLERKISILEFLVALGFAASFALIYTIIQILNIEIYIGTARLGILFFIVAFLVINFVFSLINTTEKVGIGFRAVIEEFKKQTLLGRTLTILGILASFFTIVQGCYWVITQFII